MTTNGRVDEQVEGLVGSTNERGIRISQASELANVARATAETLNGSAGRNVAVRFGRGSLEIKYIPHRATGKIHGPYLYARWRDGKLQRSRYIGKPALR